MDEFILANPDMSGEAIARALGIDGGTVRRRIRQLRKIEPQRGVCFFDMHYPDHVKPLWKNLLSFVEDFEPDVFVFGGDNMDMQPITHWVENKSRKIEGRRLKKEYEGFNADVLAPLEAVLPADARRIFHLGNHEDWVEQYIDTHPEVEGFLEVEANLALDGWETYEYGEASKVGKLYFTHGQYCNLHHAAKMVQTYHRNIVYGHLHTYQAATETTPLDTESHAAVSMPCGCHLNPHYRRHAPNSWLNGFGVFYVYPNGNFQLYPVISVDGTFIAPNGQLYG